MERNNLADLMKLIAAFGVICLHVGASTYEASILNLIFWPLCVPFFYAVSLTYFIRSLKSTPIKEVFKKTWKRIVIPYLAWTCIYVGMLWAKSILVNSDRSFVWWRVLFYGESSIHLYYIPTLLAMQAFAFGLFLLFSEHSKSKKLGWVLLAICFCYLLIGNIYDCFGVAALGQLFAMAAYLIGAFTFAGHVKDTRIHMPLIILGTGLLLVAIISNFIGIHYTVLDYPLLLPIGGIALLLLVLGLPMKNMHPWIFAITTTSYGIYLSHVLFLEAFEFAIERYYAGEAYYNFALKILVVTGVFVISVFFTYVIRTIPILKEVLLGEKNH